MTCEWSPVTYSANCIYDPLFDFSPFGILVLLRHLLLSTSPNSGKVFGALVLQSAEWAHLHAAGYTAPPSNASQPVLFPLCPLVAGFLSSWADKQTGSNLPWDVDQCHNGLSAEVGLRGQGRVPNLDSCTRGELPEKGIPLAWGQIRGGRQPTPLSRK